RPGPALETRPCDWSRDRADARTAPEDPPGSRRGGGPLPCSRPHFTLTVRVIVASESAPLTLFKRWWMLMVLVPRAPIASETTCVKRAIAWAQAPEPTYARS